MSAAPRYDRPAPSEHAPYFGRYISLVPDGNLLALLETQEEETMALLKGVPESKGNFAYAPEKWTLKEVMLHLADAERVFAYRALRFARGDATPLPGFDEKTWAPQSGAAGRTLADVLGEYGAVRAATLELFRHLPPEATTRSGTASGHNLSVRALAWIIAGHERHHIHLIRERYLS